MLCNDIEDRDRVSAAAFSRVQGQQRIMDAAMVMLHASSQPLVVSIRHSAPHLGCMKDVCIMAFLHEPVIHVNSERRSQVVNDILSRLILIPMTS
jgi:hypothetical protein